MSRDPLATRDVGAAAALALPFFAADAALLLLAPPSVAQLTASDPLTRLLDAAGGAWLLLPIGVCMLGGWWLRARPDRDALRRALVFAAAGAGAALAVGLLIRGATGPALPAFIPPEESARPGVALGLGAGALEEAVFRFGALPLAYGLARRWLPERWAIAVAAVVTGILFALSHELGPAAGAFEPRYFLTRALFPGIVMSVVFLRLHPSFIVSAHCAAHLFIPALFR